MQIPELGVFIVASPGGRCAIFSLVHVRRGDEMAYGFQLEHQLPLGKRARVLEDEFDDPDGDMEGMCLVGVAVGPVQGMWDGAEDVGPGRGLGPRRWRLLMMYDDHTVVGYELGKIERDEETPGLTDLIV